MTLMYGLLFCSFEMILYQIHRFSFRVNETIPFPGDYDEVVKRSESKYTAEFSISSEHRHERKELNGLENEVILKNKKKKSLVSHI